MAERIIILGCPVAVNSPSCCRNCGGGWPGTKGTTEQLTRALHNGQIDPNKLGCGTLYERWRYAQSQLEKSTE